jgi:probable rRNA maturation factor
MLDRRAAVIAMIEVVTRQRRRPVDAERWRRFAERALKKIGVDRATDATLVFVSDRTMRDLNRRFRRRNSTTDVLSFPSLQDDFEKLKGASLGEVVISLEQAEKQARENGLDFENEVEQLVLHGLLHLCGYDHETDRGEMNALELRLRRQLGI